VLLPETDYIVLRAGPGLPEGFLPPDVEGRWLDRTQVPMGRPEKPLLAVAVPTGRFEIREYDGAVAEVWEFQV
jgi:hypothetical protein